MTTLIVFIKALAIINLAFVAIMCCNPMNEEEDREWAPPTP